MSTSLIVGGLLYVAIEVVANRSLASDSAQLMSDGNRTCAKAAFAFVFSSWIAFFVAADVVPWDTIVLSPASLQVRPPNVLIFVMRLMETSWLLMNGLNMADVFNSDSHHGCTSWNETTSHSESEEYYGVTKDYPARANSWGLMHAALAVEVCLYLVSMVIPRQANEPWAKMLQEDKSLGLMWAFVNWITCSRPVLVASLASLFASFPTPLSFQRSLLLSKTSSGLFNTTS